MYLEFTTAKDVMDYMNEFHGPIPYGWEHLKLSLNTQYPPEEPEAEVVLADPEPEPEPSLEV